MPELAIPAAMLAGAAILTGGALAMRYASALPTVLALSGGVVVAVALLELIPEAVDYIGDAHDAGPVVAAGFLGFFLLERVLVLHHRDDAEEARSHHHVGSAGALALALHTFTDGIGIGLAFSLSTEAGFLVLIAVVGHGFADGLNTVSFVMKQSGEASRARRWLRFDAIAPVLGAAVGSLISVSDETLGYLLAAYAGFFLYMGATDILPEAHSHEEGTWHRVGLTLLGFGAVFVLTRIVAH